MKKVDIEISPLYIIKFDVPQGVIPALLLLLFKHTADQPTIVNIQVA